MSERGRPRKANKMVGVHIRLEPWVVEFYKTNDGPNAAFSAKMREVLSDYARERWTDG